MNLPQKDANIININSREVEPIKPMVSLRFGPDAMDSFSNPGASVNHVPYMVSM